MWQPRRLCARSALAPALPRSPGRRPPRSAPAQLRRARSPARPLARRRTHTPAQPRRPPQSRSSVPAAREAARRADPAGRADVRARGQRELIINHPSRRGSYHALRDTRPARRALLAQLLALQLRGGARVRGSEGETTQKLSSWTVLK